MNFLDYTKAFEVLFTTLWNVRHLSTHLYCQCSFKYKSRTDEREEILIRANFDIVLFKIGFLTEKDINIGQKEFGNYT